MNLRATLCLLLTMGLILNPLQAVASEPVRTTQTVVTLVDEFLSMITGPLANSTLEEEGRLEHLTESVMNQLTALTPEDFNMMLLYLIERYMKNPKERGPVYALIEALTKSLADDLAASEKARSGPAAYMIEGSYFWTAFIMLGGAVSWRLLFSKSARVTNFVSMVRNSAPKLGTRIVTNKWVVGTLSGIGAGYIEYFMAANRAHRLDPSKMLMIAQAQLACKLNWESLDAIETADLLVQSPETLTPIKFYDSRRQIARIHDESVALSKQFEALDNLVISENRKFLRSEETLPASSEWQALRADLTKDLHSIDGRCGEVAVGEYNPKLIKALTRLTMTYDEIEQPKDGTGWFKGPN